MSVLVPELKVFEKVYQKINVFKFNKQCDINFCSSLSLEDNQAQKFVKNILTLNELSYIKRYQEDKKPGLAEFLKFKLSEPNISTLQLLKYLECIFYNIEIYTIEKGYNGQENNKIDPMLLESYNLLKKAIEELKTTIINELTEYKDLNWCNA